MTDNAARAQLDKVRNALKRAKRVRLKTHHLYTSTICTLLSDGLQVHCEDTPYAVDYVISRRQHDAQRTAGSSL